MKQSSPAEADTTPEFLLGGGEMGKRIREYDWSNTSLGPVNTWPKSLQTCIRIMLTSRQPIWIGWGKDLIKFYNDPYKAIVGGKHPAALGKPASEVWKDIWQDIEPMLRTVMEEDEGTYVEEQLLIMERNGYPEETYYTFSYTPIPGDNGGTAGMICANTDDTQRIISDRQLKTLTEIGKELAKCNTDDEVYQATMETLSGNPQDFPFALIYELSGDHIILKTHTEIGDDLERVPKKINIKDDSPRAQTVLQALTQGTREVFPNLQQRVTMNTKGAWDKAPDKTIVMPILQAGQDPYGVIVVGANPFRLTDEKYLGFGGMIADQIATRLGAVHAIEVERKRMAGLAEIDKAKTTFFSNISHEFRTPLTLLLGPIRDALNEPEQIESNKQRMDVAWRNGLRMQKLVNMLLDFSRIEAGRMEANFSPTDICTLTEDLASSFRSTIEKAGMKFYVHCEHIEQPVIIDVDMWEKIVLNLLSNAFKYSTKGSITLSLTKTDNNIELSVADTGSGIPETEQDKIFERFHRVQNVAGRSQEGTGIGLAMVKELVKLHDGAITVKSKVNVGSEFIVSIPIYHPTPVKNEAASQRKGSQSEAYIEEVRQWLDTGLEQKSETKKNLTVLLADDNKDMRMYIQRLLSDEYNVITTINGEEAYSQAIKNRPDLIISDVMMPVLDGFGLLEKIRADAFTRTIPVIFLSARAGEESRVEGIKAGVDDYLAKPFSSKELIAKVHSLISLSQERVKNEAHLRKLFAQAPVPIAILRGPDYILELANEQYLKIIDRKNDSVGKKLFDVLPEITGTGIEELLSNVLISGERYIGQERPVPLKLAGVIELRYITFVYQPMFGDDGLVNGIFVACSDVTEQVKARQTAEKYSGQLEQEVANRTIELKRSNEGLLRVNKELEQFAYVSSHDLQEPLRKIRTFAEMVKEKVDDPEYTKKYLEKINTSAERMAALIKDVLKYSQISSEKKEFEDVDLNEVLANVKNDFELLIEQREASILNPPLPVINGNRLQLYQLFTNLISNSLKFTDKNPQIDIGCKLLRAKDVPNLSGLDTRKEHHLLSFRDNGIGFDQQYAEQIFGLFNRLQNRTDYSGTGIGLSLCKKIAENHSGVIKATSSKGEGALFEIYLPVNL